MSRWGDLPPLVPETESGIAAIEREQITKPRPVSIEGADLYQPGQAQGDQLHQKRLPPDLGVVDPITSHTIALIQHAKKVQSLLNGLQQQEKDIKPLEAEYLPSIPEGPCIPGLTIPSTNQLDMESEGRAHWKPPVQLGSSATRVVLKRAVTAVCAHAGFDAAPNSVLEVLTDLCGEFYQRLCWQLRSIVDREALTGQTGFVDAMDHALHECGVQGLLSLTTFFQERVLNYNRHMLSTCRRLHEAYEKIKLPSKASLEDVKNIKVKEEPVSEIHFPSSQEESEEASCAPVVGDTAAEDAHSLEELHRALQHMEGAQQNALKDEESIRWPATIQQQPHSQQTLPHRKASTASSGHLDPDEEIVIVNDSPPLPADAGIPSFVDTMDSASLDAAKLGRLPPAKKKYAFAFVGLGPLISPSAHPPQWRALSERGTRLGK
ncbi:unnamed protein product [Ixodes pacificus]